MGSWIAIGLALAAGGASSPGFPRPLQPTSYRSPSGVYELYVDPTTRTGGGPADCELRRDGVPVWSRRLEVTFVDADVLDDGRAAGCGYSRGRGWVAGLGEFVLLTLAADGSVTGAHREPERHSRAMDGYPDPSVRRMACDGARGRVVVELWDTARDGNPYAWHAFDLGDASPLDTRLPQDVLGSRGESAFLVCGMRAVPDTPWMLVHWQLRGESRFTLVGENETRPVLLLPRDFLVATAKRGIWSVLSDVGRHGGIASVGAGGRFAVVSFARGERIAYAAREVDGAWTVEETGRTPWEPARAEPPPEPEVRELELRPLGAVELRVDDATDHGGLERIAGAYVDPGGRVWVSEGGPGALHAFDAAGRHLVSCVPPPEDLTRRGGFPLLAVDGLGDLYARSGRYDGRWVQHAPDGWRAVPFDAGSGTASRGLAFAPGTRERWVAHGLGARVVRESPGGEALAAIERLPDRRWFTGVSGFAVAPDGTLAIADWTSLAPEVSPRLAWYAPDGTPLGVVDLPRETHPYHVATNARWTLVSGYREGLLLVDRADGRMAFVRTTSEGAYSAGFGPDGRELWRVEPATGRLLRFALP